MAKNQNIARGSYRIHIDNLNYYFNSINIYSKINPNNIEDFDVIIYDKNYISIKKIKNKLCGSITPSADNYKLLREIDFIIVGSVEEKDSMIKYNKNCFLFPQIEKKFQKIEPKIHTKKNKIIIGYHGNSVHLNHMHLGLKNALGRLSKELPIKLIYISNTDKHWIQGIANIEKEFKKWNIKTIINDIKTFDIGIVPNISEAVNDNRLNTNMTLGLYNTDFKIRFKNKSNIGRSLVLFQCGIPVIADITPSNMHILADPNNGYAVLSEDGWYNALKNLCCEKHRNFIAKNAYNECKRLYDPLVWAQKLIISINNINK